MKSTDRILAVRYARAFDALSATVKQAELACKHLSEAAASLHQAQRYMQDPAVSYKEKASFVRQLFGQDSMTVGFISTLLEAKRYYLLEACVQEVSRLLDKRQGVVRAAVQTAYELTAAQQKKVQETLSQFTGKQVKAAFDVKPALLGGLCARVEDTLIDGTIKRRFEKLQEELIQ